MSDVFYLNIPRARGPRGPPSSVAATSIMNNNNLLLRDHLPRAGSPAAAADGLRLLPLAACVVSVGCAVFVAARVWGYRRRCISSLLSRGKTGGRRRGQQRICGRVVYHASMDGIPLPKNRTPLNSDTDEDVDTPPAVAAPAAVREGKKDNDNNDVNSEEEEDSVSEYNSSSSSHDDNDDDGDNNGDANDKREKRGRGDSNGKALRRKKEKEERAKLKSSPILNSTSENSSQIFITSSGERYKRLSQLGRGGFGVVFKCISLSTGKFVAVKETRLAENSNKNHGDGDANSNGSTTDELRSEFEFLSSISHPHIIRVIGYHVGRKHARLFLEWAAGGSLSDVLKGVCKSSSSEGKRKGGLQEELVRSYIHQMLEALQCLHAHGIIHRDVKPQNMLIDHVGLLRVTDFGLSRLLVDGASAVETVIAGTPRYMAPEIIQVGRFSYASDIWAVGAVMSELLTGKLPWMHVDPVHQNPVQSLLYYIATHPEDHPVIPADISEAAKDFMKQCFQPRPEDRGTAASLLQHSFLKQESVEDKKEETKGR